MANSFWNFVTQMVSGTLAKAEDVNTNLSGIETGFDSVETELNKAIQVTNSPGTTDITENAAARANKLVQFGATGNVELGTVVGDYQGNHADAAGTVYYVRDVVKDAAGRLGLNNIYICNTQHTSTGGIDTDTANWDLLINVADVEAAKTAAEAAQAAAELVYDNFDDRYLGAKAADPALDNDGNALITGALYFNTTTNNMKVYDGGAWNISTANAVDVALADAGGHYAAASVEAAFAELAGTSANEGASIIGLEDSGGFYTGADVEAALAELRPEYGVFSAVPYGSATAGTPSGSFVGEYMRIHNCVHFQFQIYFSVSTGGMNGTIRVPLPFTPSIIGSLSPVGHVPFAYDMLITSGNHIGLTISKGLSYVTFSQGTFDGSGWTSLNQSHFQVGSLLKASGFYYIAP